jgi:hypothetical protein
MFLVHINGSFCSSGTMSIYTSPAMITIYSILSLKRTPRHLSSPVEEGPSSSAGRHRPQKRGPWGLRAFGFTNLQISKKEVVVRHIGNNATILHEFKEPVDIMERS